MADSASRLPQEIITEILLCLPAKSIGQFRCVSKPWRALLCNPEFVKDHLRRHAHDQEKLLLLSTSTTLFTLTFRTAATSTTGGSDGILKKLNLFLCEASNWLRVLGSCNGLGLVINGEGSKYLINPTTLEYAKLSNSPVALDPNISYSMHAFGYDRVNDDYKIVTLSYYDYDKDYDTDDEDGADFTETFVDVYSAKMGSWRRLGSSPYDHAVPEDDFGSFLNGALHWLAFRKSPGYSFVIAAFNLANEVFEELPPPATLDKDRLEKPVFNRLLVLGGCLCMVDDHFSDHIDVWVMKEYGIGESWTKFSYGIEYDYAKPLCQFGDEEYIGVHGHDLLVYNLKQKTSRDMVTDGPLAQFEDGVTFIESLVSPNFNSWNDQRSSQLQD